VYKKYKSHFALFLVCALALFSSSHIPTRADEGIAMQQDENSNAVSVGMATNNAGKALLTGRRVISTRSYSNVGWIKQIDVATGLGDSAFNSADDDSININVTQQPPDAGSVYLDLSNSQKETLCTAATWDNENSVWWVACRSLNSSNKYAVYFLKVTTTGTITSYLTTIGGGTGSNKNGYPGRQGSLLLEGSNLVLVGYRGTTLSNPVKTSTDYRPFIAKFAISSAQNNWAPSALSEFTSTDSDSSTGAYNYRAVAVVSDGSYYYSVYTHLQNGGFKVGKFSASNLSASDSGFFSSLTFPSATVGNSPYSVPTSMAFYNNKLFLAGSVRSNSNSAYYGVVAAIQASNGNAVTTCDGDGFNLFQVSSNHDTLLNDVVTSGNSLMLAGASYNGTNYKAFTGKLSLANSACSFDNTYGSGGAYFYAEGPSDNFTTATKKAGADMNRLKADLKSPEVKARIQNDMDEGQKLGVRGTPKFFINGVSLTGARPLSDFESIIDRWLKKI
jgi:hypothetical protein